MRSRQHLICTRLKDLFHAIEWPLESLRSCLSLMWLSPDAREQSKRDLPGDLLATSRHRKYLPVKLFIGKRSISKFQRKDRSGGSIKASPDRMQGSLIFEFRLLGRKLSGVPSIPTSMHRWLPSGVVLQLANRLSGNHRYSSLENLETKKITWRYAGCDVAHNA